MGIACDVRIPLHPLTVEDYERIVDAGILGEGDRVELLNGQLAEMSPQGPQHAAAVTWLAARLIRGIDPAVASVRVQAPVRFAPLSEPEPDIAIVAAGAHAKAHPSEASLVIEVAVTTQSFNLGAKAEIYAAAGVGEYWVVDVPARAVHVHGSPSGSGFGSYRTVTRGRLRPPVAGAPEIDVDRLFEILD
jgi:Uma2 family endonuclease